MADTNQPANLCGNSLNTLAYNGTTPVGVITGEGSDMSNSKAMKSKGKRKLISQTMALSLIDIAKRKEAPQQAKTYWNTYHCQNKITSHDGKLYGKYCKNRSCTLCLSIRKAEIINKYFPVIKEWQEPYLVTLTIKACSAKRLNYMFKGVLRGFSQIYAKCKKRNQRGNGIKLMGIKSLECNFNPVKRTYNPHLHLIVANKEMAELLIDEWLQKFTSKFATRKAQDYRRIYNIETALIETIKYGSKIFTEPDVNKEAENKGTAMIQAAALYNIFEAMKGLRIFDRFGFNLPKTHQKERKGARAVTGHSEWVFMAKYHDWLNIENELTLSGYIPDAKLAYMLKNYIDVQTE